MGESTPPTDARRGAGHTPATGDARGAQTETRRRVIRGVLAGLLLASVSVFGASAVAAGASGPQPVTLTLHGQITLPASVTGTWRATGAISDSGAYTETFDFSDHGAIVDTSKVLVGSSGTIVLKAHARVVQLSPTRVAFVRGKWFVDFGTGAYAGLRASGRPAATPDSFADLATSEILIVHEGFVRG
jgi:hypothetical protein